MRLGNEFIEGAFVSPFRWGDEGRRAYEITNLRRETTSQAIRNLIEGLSDEVALVDRDWNIIATNEAWRLGATRDHAVSLLSGGNYRIHCRSLSLKGTLLEALDDFANGRRARLEHLQEANCATVNASYRVHISAVSIEGSAFAMITRHEISEVLRLQEHCEQLAASVLGVQEDERRRIGRELHDSTAQLLVALQLDLMRLKETNSDMSSSPVVNSIAETISRIHSEIRAASFIFHPPAFEGKSIGDAVTELVNGFGERAGLRTSVWCGVKGVRHWSAREATLYRVAQEALANAYRHARATEVDVALLERPHYLHLVVCDNGVGMPETFRSRATEWPALGVGISGMRERLLQLGGRLSFARPKLGTCLVASVPLAQGRIRQERRRTN